MKAAIKDIDLLIECIRFATEVHGLTEASYAGLPYIHHPMRVMLKVDSVGAKIVAVLHDVIEDTAASYRDIAELGVSKELLGSLFCLTRRAGQTYSDYLDRVKGDAVAREVKLADIADHLDHKSTLKPSLEKRYLAAREFLTEV